MTIHPWFQFMPTQDDFHSRAVPMVGLQHATHAKLAAYAGDAEATERSTRAALDILLVPREASRSPDG